MRGDETVAVEGVSVAAQRETERMRQLEFLQLTNNPVDLQITGVPGRAEVLREVAHGMGLKSDIIVPTDNQLEMQGDIPIDGQGPQTAPAPQSDRQAMMQPQNAPAGA